MLFIEVLDAPAWRALSHGAKALYIALRRRYNATIDNNGKIYLPQRTAQRELDSHRDQIARWFRELNHYGFIVLTSAGRLGVRGHGRAPRWQLTELPYNDDPATKNFLAWNGVPFGSQKTESRPGNPGQGGPENRAKETASEKVSLGLENRAKGLARETGPNLDLLSMGREGAHEESGKTCLEMFGLAE
jgi:hypothetical protein